MKFKNYKNSYTNSDIIYSKKNIADMSVREVFNKKDEIIAQHDSIGIPGEGELQSSPNAVWVEAYVREDGTEVKAHWRSKPEVSSDNVAENSIKTNNEQGDVTGGAANVKDESLKNITLKKNYQTNSIQDKLIDYNNEQNKEYPDARDCMNIAIIGPDNIIDNQNYKLLSTDDVKDINSKSGVKISDDIKTVQFSNNSSMANSLNNSHELNQQLKENVSKIENGNNIQVTFKKDVNLFRSLHNATVFNCKIEGSIVTGYIYDKYDFDYQSYNQKNKIADINKINLINDAAASLQRLKVIKNYNILVPIKIKL